MLTLPPLENEVPGEDTAASAFNANEIPPCSAEEFLDRLAPIGDRNRAVVGVEFQVGVNSQGRIHGGVHVGH